RAIEDFQIPHHDGAGVIEAVGAGVDPGRVGERVWLWLAAAGRRGGTAAGGSALPPRPGGPLPDGASLRPGGSAGGPAMTAHYCLLCDGPVTGRTVLVAGGAGAVGHFAIELAKRAGARVVTTVSSPDKAALAEKAGADLVVNYRSPDAADQVMAFGPVDRVIEVAIGANFQLDLATAGPHATIVTYAAEPANPELPVRACMTATLTLKSVSPSGGKMPALDQAAADTPAALNAGELTGLPVHKSPLADIAAAHRAAESGAVGKVIVPL